MLTKVNRLLLLSAAFASLAALPAAAASSEAERDEERMWTVGLAAISGITFQEQSSSVSSYILSEDPVEPLRPWADGEQWVVSPYVGMSLELMSPVIPVLPGRMRVFAVAEFLPMFSSSRDIATEGDASGITFPEDKEGRVPPVFSEDAIGGVGSKTTSEILRNAFAAGIGVAFPFEFRERKFRAKPSVGWLYYEVLVTGDVIEAFKPDPADDFVRAVELSDGEIRAFNGVGLGFELEMDMKERWGPIRPSLFLDLHAYRILGDLSVELQDVQTYSDQIGTDTYGAQWRYKVEPWMFRAGAGVRLRWVGF